MDFHRHWHIENGTVEKSLCQSSQELLGGQRRLKVPVCHEPIQEQREMRGRGRQSLRLETLQNSVLDGLPPTGESLVFWPGVLYSDERVIEVRED